MDKRKTTIQQYQKRGLSYREIGKILKISRQRVHQIANDYYKNKGLRIIGRKIELEGRDFLKEIVRIRDNYTCQICGKTWKKGKRRFDVHHLEIKNEGINGLKYKNCKDFNKMITFCHKCHLRLPHIRKKMSDSRLRACGKLA